MELDDLRKFVIEANKAGYASGDNGQLEEDGSKTIVYISGNFKSDDNYFGGEPFGGRTTVSYKGKVEWMMVYYGGVNVDESPEEIYVILRKALSQMPQDRPFRGPESLEEGDLKYKNTINGDLKRFWGEEEIFKNGLLVYKAQYSGGLVDQREG